ncbi:hypothetical protein WJX73_002238 [Symbiochloris irregularis]|uniref:Peptidase C1A papain C-terminal domain-containing protein n=1 Tax=Symbiochloris irregularis TaxID=706552 RepID=A0AAW1PPP2_9CHLO
MNILIAGLTALCTLYTSAEAKGYRNGYQPPERTEEELSFNHQPLPLLAEKDLPKEWNWCDVNGPNLCVSSWNQHIPVYCGACWAHGSLSMIQDRLKIQKKGRGPDVMLGRQTLLNCGAYYGMGAGCNGGDVIDVFHYMEKFGLPDESCFTYQATDHSAFDSSLKECPANAICRNCMPNSNETLTCWSVKTPILYKLSSYGKLEGPKDDYARAMQTEIFKRGPITCSIATPNDFTYGYRGGVFKGHSNSTKDDIDHDVEVVGWAVRDGVDVWIVRNSWGTFWGHLGFFEIERGINSLRIEGSDCWYAEPDFQMEEDVISGKLQGSMYGLVGEDTQLQQVTGRITAA